jgi:hypothetical protein
MTLYGQTSISEQSLHLIGSDQGEWPEMAGLVLGLQYEV